MRVKTQVRCVTASEWKYNIRDSNRIAFMSRLPRTHTLVRVSHGSHQRVTSSHYVVVHSSQLPRLDFHHAVIVSNELKNFKN